MSEPRQTLRPEYFDALYTVDLDPWKFATSPYERGKYTLTLNAMPKPRYRSALEVGCSIGVLTRSLASRCDAVVAIDAAPIPVAEARRRCADLPGVRFEQMFVPDQWPDGVFELILLSEVIYYLSREDVARLASRVTRSLSRGGSVILVHWMGVATRKPGRIGEASPGDGRRKEATPTPNGSSNIENPESGTRWAAKRVGTRTDQPRRSSSPPFCSRDTHGPD